MNVSYQKLFSISVVHAYYGGLCEDFEFLIPAGTARDLARGRALVKSGAGVLHVLYEVEEAGNPRASLAGTTLRFGLRAVDPYLANVTEPALPVPPNVAVCRNIGKAAMLGAAQLHRQVSDVFSHGLRSPQRPVSVALKQRDGSTLRDELVTSSDVTRVTFDLGNVEPNALSIEEDYGGGDVSSNALYSCAELQRATSSHIVEIDVSDDFYAAPEPKFEIAFGARKETLKYYVVARKYSDDDFAALRVADVANEVQFARIEADQLSNATDLDPNLLIGGDARVVQFKSTTTVERRERGRKIQLKRDNDVLIESLKLPSADRADANLIVHISKVST
jgi:hypothetical protein